MILMIEFYAADGSELTPSYECPCGQEHFLADLAQLGQIGDKMTLPCCGRAVYLKPAITEIIFEGSPEGGNDDADN